MANLGFVGLGVMGSRMVNRLLDKGHTVTGYNRTRSKAQWLIDRGMKWADSPRAVAAAADVTLSMVTNSAALQEIADGAERNHRRSRQRQNLDRNEHRQPGNQQGAGRLASEKKAPTCWMRRSREA